MDAGQFDRRVTIQAPTQSSDTYGEQTPAYAEVATVWARRIEQSAHERLRAEKLQTGEQVIYRIRDRSEWRTTSPIEPKQRLQDGALFYEIMSVSEGRERNAYLDLLCVRVVQ